MRRKISTLSALGLLALSLSVPLAPASASDDGGQGDGFGNVDDSTHNDSTHDDDQVSGVTCEDDGAAEVLVWTGSHEWAWNSAGYEWLSSRIRDVLDRYTHLEHYECESPPVPVPEVPVLPVDTSETPTQPPDTSVDGATETNPANGESSPEVESPSDGQASGRAPVVQRAPVAIPRLSASVDCAALVVAAELSNVGDAPGLVDVFLVTESVRTGVALPVGELINVNFPVPEGAEGESLNVVVSDQHGVVATSEVTVDCESPADVVVSAVVICQAHVIDLMLTNRGEESASVDVLVERTGRVAAVDLAGGQTRTLEVDAAGRSMLPLRVVVDGDDVLRRDVAIECPQPDIGSSASISCVSGEVLVSVWNRGDAAGIVAVSSGDVSLTDISVQPRSVVVAGLPFNRALASVTVNVTDGSGLEIDSDVLPNPCDPTAPNNSAPCSSVAVFNTSGSTQSLVMTPSPGEPWWVDAGAVPSATAGDAGMSAVRSCADPSVVFVADCGVGSVQVVLSNGGSISTRLAILVDGGAAGSSVDVGPGETTTIFVEVDDSSRVEVVEAGRAEPLMTLDLECDSNGNAPQAAYAVFAFSIAGSLLAMAGDPRKLWFLVR